MSTRSNITEIFTSALLETATTESLSETEKQARVQMIQSLQTAVLGQLDAQQNQLTTLTNQLFQLANTASNLGQ